MKTTVKLQPKTAIAFTALALLLNLQPSAAEDKRDGKEGSPVPRGVVKSLNGLEGRVSLWAGSNITILPSGNGFTISATGATSSVGGSNAWRRTGNAAAPGDFLGTLNDQALEFRVNGQRAFRLEPNTNDAPNVIGGSSLNFVTPGVMGATIAGGGVNILFQNALPNSIAANFGAIGGGYANSIQASNSVIGGGYANYIGSKCQDSTIGGGLNNGIVDSRYSTIAGGLGNGIQSKSDSCTVGGGRANYVLNAQDSTIAGGVQNTIQSGAIESVIGGGVNNTIGSNSFGAFIGAGKGNVIKDAGSFIGTGSCNTIEHGAGGSVIVAGTLQLIQTDSGLSTICGGAFNAVLSNTYCSTIGGGRNNTNSGWFATVPGGNENLAGGTSSFAAGHRAKAIHHGAFVWADSTDADVASTAGNQFVARASGGVVFYSNPDLTSGVFLAPGGGSWSMLSDRNSKENVEPVNGRAVLDKLCALPLATWNYKSQDTAIRHLGPMAQDFHAAFQIGEDEKHITAVDADGVALAAIQGLNQKLEEQYRQHQIEITSLRRELAEMKELVQSLSHPLGEIGQ